MAEKTSNMPLQGELGLINYLQGIFSGKVANPNYTGASVPAPVTAPLMSGQDMQNIMTEFLRGNGQFLDQMRQQNMAGLYNSSTRNLVANDLTAQAALKASTANSAIQQQNAAILNNYNARVAAQQPKYLPNSQGGMGKVAAALGIAGIDKLLGGALGGGSKKKSTSSSGKIEEKEASASTAEGGAEDVVGTLLGIGGGLNMFSDSPSLNFDVGNVVDNFSVDTSSSNFIPEVVSSALPTEGFDLAFLDNLSLPDFNFDLPDFDLPDFDFLDIGSWFS